MKHTTLVGLLIAIAGIEVPIIHNLHSQPPISNEIVQTYLGVPVEPVTSLALAHLPGEPPEPYVVTPYLGFYAYAEVVNRNPADILLDTLKDVPVGTPAQEIKLASEAFGIDPHFMKVVAKIESDFNPTERTGQYIGLFQLSHYEFDKYGSGSISSPRDNAIAAAYKFATAAAQLEIETHVKPTTIDLYMVHQQGEQGAEEHIEHPDWPAWQSMCATDEGKEKGVSWCKRAVWGNTLPTVKAVWKTVDNLTSGAFVAMWGQRIDKLLGVAMPNPPSPPMWAAAKPQHYAMHRHRAAHYAHYGHKHLHYAKA